MGQSFRIDECILFQTFTSMFENAKAWCRAYWNGNAFLIPSSTILTGLQNIFLSMNVASCAKESKNDERLKAKFLGNRIKKFENFKVLKRFCLLQSMSYEIQFFFFRYNYNLSH